MEILFSRSVIKIIIIYFSIKKNNSVAFFKTEIIKITIQYIEFNASLNTVSQNLKKKEGSDLGKDRCPTASDWLDISSLEKSILIKQKVRISCDGKHVTTTVFYKIQTNL